MQFYRPMFFKFLHTFLISSNLATRQTNHRLLDVFHYPVGGVRHPQHTQTGSNSSTIATVWQIPDTVDTVVRPPDDGWWYHPKHVEQFPDKINCVTLHLVGYIYIYIIYLSGLLTAVAVFRNPNTIPFCLATDLLLNVLFSWLLVHLPSTFFWTSSFSSFPWYPLHN